MAAAAGSSVRHAARRGSEQSAVASASRQRRGFPFPRSPAIRALGCSGCLSPLFLSGALGVVTSAPAAGFTPVQEPKAAKPKGPGQWRKKRYTSCSQQDQRWGSISDGFCQGGWHRVRPLPDGSHGRIHPFHRGRRFRGGIVQGLTRASNRFIAGFVFSRAAQTWVTAWRMRR